MNKGIKKVVYKILEQDELAREDTWYLIEQTAIEMLPCNQGTAFEKVIQGMKYKGISLEAITRHKRKFLEDNPHLVTAKNEEIRRNEELAYHMEYARR